MEQKKHEPMRGSRKQNAGTVRRDRIVNEEHVICANCYYQFSYLYEGKKDVPPDRPHEVLHAAVEVVIRNRLARYRKLDECFHPCPNCGYAQPWMVRIVRRLRIRTAVSITMGLLCLDYLAYAYLTKFAGVLAADPSWAFALGGLAIIGGSIAVYHALRIWDPNESVDQQSFGGAARVSDVEPPIDWNPKLALSLVPHTGPHRHWVRTLFRWLAALALASGCLVFSLPLIFEGIAYHLERLNVVMVPFWAGIILMAVGCGMAVVVGLQKRLQQRRYRFAPSSPNPAGGARTSRQNNGNTRDSEKARVSVV